MTELPKLKAHLMEHAQPLIDSLEQRIELQWDDHFLCVLSEFSVDHESQVYMAAKKHFPYIWDRKTIKRADPFLLHRAGEFGALVKNQRLMTMDTTGQHDVMLAWWPWGHGATISVRVFEVNTAPYVPPSGLIYRLKNLISKTT